MRKYFEEGLKQLNIKLNEETITKLLKYAEMLKEKNKTVNLTAIKEDEEIIEKHFIDSLTLVDHVADKKGTAIDVGTGAGFPGMVLAIALPEMHFTLLDSIGKKTSFIEEVAEALDIRNVEVINARAEDFIKNNPEKRESYDFGFTRAVAELRIINEYIIPFLKVNGIMYAQKANYEIEVQNSKKSFEVLKSKVSKIYELKLPYSEDRRAIVEIIKMESTDLKYPRRAGVPTKKPL